MTLVTILNLTAENAANLCAFFAQTTAHITREHQKAIKLSSHQHLLMNITLELKVRWIVVDLKEGAFNLVVYYELLQSYHDEKDMDKSRATRDVR